jgi:hypothetical protein
MATLFKINLSPKSETVILPTQTGGKVVDMPMPIRDIEKDILTTCVGLAAAREKDLKKYGVCADLYSQIDALGENTEALTDLTEEDISIIKTGFGVSADLQGGRPFRWMKCGALRKQILNPLPKDEQKS